MRAWLLLLLPLSAVAGEYDWKVTRQWSPALEKKFQEFVSVMGESGCKSLNACLTSASGNPLYVNRTPKGKKYQADCADFPYALRLYFSWMEGLPFDYVNRVVQANPREEPNDDIRYTKFGNKPAGRREIRSGNTFDAFRELDSMRDSVSTATYRMHYNEISDFYPAALNRAAIQPGTVVYDPSGHAAIVYKIEKDGRIKMMDAHPDNSVTRITFDQKFTRSRPAHGSGLKLWRPELSGEGGAYKYEHQVLCISRAYKASWTRETVDLAIAGKTTLERRAETRGDRHSYGDRHDYGEERAAAIACGG
jgi:hypothetical protein